MSPFGSCFLAPSGMRTSARELPNPPLEDALQFVRLYFERGSPKYERAALRWLERYFSEGTPSLRDVAEVTSSLAGTPHPR